MHVGHRDLFQVQIHPRSFVLYYHFVFLFVIRPMWVLFVLVYWTKCNSSFELKPNSLFTPAAKSRAVSDITFITCHRSVTHHVSGHAGRLPRSRGLIHFCTDMNVAAHISHGEYMYILDELVSSLRASRLESSLDRGTWGRLDRQVLTHFNAFSSHYH